MPNLIENCPIVNKEINRVTKTGNDIQSTLVISTLSIPNNRLSGSENLVPV